MKLLLDLGNTRLKWAWLEAGRLRGAGESTHGGQVGGDALGALASVATRPEEILLSSVAGPVLTTALATWLTGRWPVPLRQARSEGLGSGVTNGYCDAAQMGVDRWLALVAAWNRHRAAVCVADAGTALTVDLVAADGRHEGGLILPGPTLMRGALLRDTGAIAASGARAAPAGRARGERLGRDTESCIALAAWRAAAALVAACLQPPDGGAAPRLVLTGGDAPQLLAALGVEADHRPALVLEGLALRLCGVLPEPELPVT